VGGTCDTHGGGEVGHLERPRSRWEDNIKMDIKEGGIDGANWIRLALTRVQWRVFVNTVVNLWVPQRKLAVVKLSNYRFFQRISCTMEFIIYLN
jgi:hypothetical protein